MMPQLELARRDTDSTLVETPRLKLPPGAQELIEVHRNAEKELHKILVGIEEAVSLTLAGVYTSSHVLLQGAPGLAKTLLAKSISQVFGLSFKRQQFTSDLMPADITGGLMLPPGGKEYYFSRGPIFTNVFLADEINRTPPKTQSALLEAMEEHQVTVGGVSYKLPEPFFVVATQNEINTPGTFPLPHAQLDRFATKIIVPLPDRQELVEIGDRTTNGYQYKIEPVLNPDTAQSSMARFREAIYSVEESAEMKNIIAGTILALCPPYPEALPEVKKYIQEGPLVRGLQSVTILAKTLALLDGRMNMEPKDIVRAAVPALNHRLVPKMFSGKASEVSVKSLIERAVENAIGG